MGSGFQAVRLEIDSRWPTWEPQEMRLTDPDGHVLTVAQVETPVDPARALERGRRGNHDLSRRGDRFDDGPERLDTPADIEVERQCAATQEAIRAARTDADRVAGEKTTRGQRVYVRCSRRSIRDCRASTPTASPRRASPGG
jgi:hypothetical protein